jgi:plastocyanin
MKRSIGLIYLFIILVIVLTACAPKEYKFNVKMEEFKFIPDSFSVPAGVQVTMEMENTGALEHELVIMLLGKDATLPFDENDEANVYWETELQPGTKQTVTFTAPSEPGEYQLVCGTAGHLEQGMKGTLTVTE